MLLDIVDGKNKVMMTPSDFSFKLCVVFDVVDGKSIMIMNPQTFQTM